jgi:hypothetical protein
MPSVPISQLPPVSEVSPSAYVPIDQNGVTSRATAAQIGAAAQDLTQSFLTVGSESGTLPNSRSAGATNGITRTDSGAGGTLTFSLTGQALNFFLLSTTGLTALTGGGSVVTRALVGPGKGFTISNADGVAGNPTFALTGGLLALEDLTGPGVVCSTGVDTFAPRTLTGTASQIDITEGQGAGGNPTFAIADDPRLPGTGGFLPPGGTTAQRPLSPPVGFTRRNTDLNVNEAWDGAQWVSQGVAGVTSVATGTGLTGGPITSTGTISIANTGVTADSYGDASTVPVLTINAQGQVTDATTATITPASIGGVPTSRTLMAGTGLTGGGDLSADRTFAVEVPLPDLTGQATNIPRVDAAGAAIEYRTPAQTCSDIGALATDGDGSSVTVTTTAGAPTTRTLADRAEDYVSSDTSLTSRVTVGTAQAATSTTITLDAGNAAVDDMFNGLDIVITGGTGAGQTRLITGYVGVTRVATVSTAWATTPDATSTYDIRIPAGTNGNGQQWRWIVKDWTSNIGNGGGGRFVCEFDTSAAGDWSSSQEVSSWSINVGPAMNGCDGEMYFYEQALHLVSDNDLRLPPTPPNNDVVSGIPKTGTTSDPLDVGPQFIGYRGVANPPAGSQLFYLMMQGQNSAGTPVIYAGILNRVADPTAGSEAGEIVFDTLGGALNFVLGGGPTSEKGTGLWVQSATGYAPYVGPDGTCDNQGDGTINMAGVYDQGRRVAVTSGSNQAVLTTTGATNVTLPTTGTLATLAGTETMYNKTLGNTILSGTMTGGTLSGATLSNATTTGNLTVGNTSGAMALFSGGDGNGYFQLSTTGVISFRTANGGASQARIVHTASANRTVDITGANSGNPGIGASAGFLAFSSAVVDKSYTVATLPSAASAGGFIYVSDESGGAVPAFADGTNWRRVTDRAIVS